MKKVLITGAAGNLGGLLSEYLKDSGLQLNLMYHKKEINPELRKLPNVNTYKVDLIDKSSIGSALSGVDTIVHFAGILFKNNPEKFLPITNTLYFKNLVDVAIEHKVRRIILISFPHVEGETTPNNPAKGVLNGNPISVHATTRLQEEQYLFRMSEQEKFEAVSLRIGMVYGKGILMMDTARWFARYGILGIWKKPTYIHLISKADLLETTKQAIMKENVNGIYHVGDDGKQTLQEFLQFCTRHWGYGKPKQLPVKLILMVARIFEFSSYLFGVRSPLTRDFVKIGMVSYYGDTKRMREELLPVLRYANFKEGNETI